jgi:outer membrane protein assembly factor BamB
MAKFLSRILFLALIVSGCSSKNKIKNPVDFTPKIVVMPQDYSYRITVPVQVKTWLNSPTGHQNVYLTNISKFVSYKILKSDISFEPIVNYSDYIYVIDKLSNIYKIAYDKKPKIIWTYNLLQDNKEYSGGGILYHSFDDKNIYITNGSRYLFVLKEIDGSYVVQKKFPDIIKTRPVVDSGNVYVQDVSNTVYAFNLDKTTIIWKNKDNIRETLINQYERQLWLNNKDIISLSSNGVLSALDKNTGLAKWRIDFFENNDIQSLIGMKDFSNKGYFVDEHIYVSSSNGYFYKVEAKDGKIIYKVKLPNVQNISKLGNLIIVTNCANQVIAICPETGKFIWASDLFDKKEKDIVITKLPQIFNNLIYIFTNKGQIVKINPINGKIEGIIKAPKGSLNYVVNSDRLFIFSKKSLFISE